MTDHRLTTVKKESRHQAEEKILLALLPVWDPLIPPLGIACLKCFVQEHGYQVKTVDANVEPALSEVHKNYFEFLKEHIPANRRRHIYNIGHEVLKNHMMAHINVKNENEYIELVKILVFKTFFTAVDRHRIIRLNGIIREFYLRLETYLTALLDREKPAILGLSVYSGTLAASLYASRLVKEKYPHVKVVMGGGIFSSELAIDSPEFNFFLEKACSIDKIIVGEGEQLFLKFLQGKLPETQKVVTLKELDGATLDITTVGLPDFSDFDLAHYLQMASYTSRSCPFQCKFCVETTYWGTFRKKNAVQIANELVNLEERYDKRLFLMCDSLLNPVITDLTEECIKTGAPVYWGGYLRVAKEVCDTQNTLRWRRGGFYRARLGVESGSPRMLTEMGKKIPIDQIKSAISSLALAGIKTSALFVIGYPGETEEDFQMTLDLIEALKDDIYEADCNPFWYFLTGQVNSNEWNKKNKALPLYPEKFRDMLILQTWILDTPPTREESYHRVNRFIEHCHKLRVPNPYTLRDTQEADQRWKRLHQNAVPSLVEINSSRVEWGESKRVEDLALAGKEIPRDDGNWDFE
jgi:radical SAM superfamily enzyme YgiQ (UPF0313 family)